MRINLKYVAPALALALTVACGGGGEEHKESTRAKPAAQPAGGGGYTVAAVTDGGKVSGSVKFEGTPPPLEKVEVSKDPAVCGKEKVLETVQVGSGNGLKGVVVWIENISKGKDWGSIDGGEVDQTECHYKPYIQIIKVGEQVNIKNSDSVLHNIHAYYKDTETLFNLAQPMKGMSTPKKLEKSGPVHFKCDVHSWMSAYAFVAAHPYYAISGDDGSFSLDDVPAGSYKLHAWHPKFGEKTADATVTAGGTATASFTMP